MLTTILLHPLQAYALSAVFVFLGAVLVHTLADEGDWLGGVGVCALGSAIWPISALIVIGHSLAQARARRMQAAARRVQRTVEMLGGMHTRSR